MQATKLFTGLVRVHSVKLTFHGAPALRIYLVSISSDFFLSWVNMLASVKTSLLLILRARTYTVSKHLLRRYC